MPKKEYTEVLQTGVGPDDFVRFHPTWTILWFCKKACKQAVIFPWNTIYLPEFMVLVDRDLYFDLLTTCTCGKLQIVNKKASIMYSQALMLLNSKFISQKPKALTSSSHKLWARNGCLTLISRRATLKPFLKEFCRRTVARGMQLETSSPIFTDTSFLQISTTPEFQLLSLCWSSLWFPVFSTYPAVCILAWSQSATQ